MGPLRRICHWGPLTTLGIIKIITLMAIHCSRQCWPPGESFSAAMYFLLFFSLSGSTLYHFINAAYEGPGFLPLKWMPAQSSDTEFLQYCTICEGYKAPRSHHCRKCGRCVLKMDHHCPWINNCVGHFNHGHFTAFLASAVAGCCMSTFTLVSWLMRVLSYRMLTFHPPSLLVLILVVFTIGLSIGVALAVGMLLYFQLRAIFKNRTGIEDWIIEKAQFRRQGTGEVFVHPYSRGWLIDARDVLSWHCSPKGDGILWPVVEGCDQYTLTCLAIGNRAYKHHFELPLARRFGAKSNEPYIDCYVREQLSQKQEKRRRTQRYRIISAVSGSWIPISQGCCVVCHPPCTDEPRIKLDVDDVVLVTRWRTYWLFGEKEQDGRAEYKTNRVRGWFPRTCAVEIVGGQYLRSTKRD